MPYREYTLKSGAMEVPAWIETADPLRVGQRITLTETYKAQWAVVAARPGERGDAPTPRARLRSVL